MTTYIISLERSDNPDFYRLADEHGELMRRWNAISDKLVTIRIPRLLFWHTKKKLVTIRQDVAELQIDFLEWKGRACNFFLFPRYSIDARDKGDIIFLHSTDTMRDLVHHLDSSMIIMAENYNKIASSYEHRKDFMLAISAFLISFIGLAISIVGLLISLRDNTNPSTSEKIIPRILPAIRSR